MDTISSDNNDSFSYLPILALIVGLIAGVLGGVALAKVSNINQSLSEQSAVADRVDALETELRKTSTSAVEEMHPQPAPAQQVANSAPAESSSGSSAPATAAGTYTVKGGDTGSKIARNAGISLNALLNANPGVNWNRIGIGQVLNIPGN